ncbi:uncharacterized protein LOC132631583 isoform X1 [Lycium barbarum]|uniref:uncharacterized protein LOC132631583 isoform X1 n=1 Tax=Lycium barbarum TaxID=112863 RepID=UPI00293E9A7C|nr:uncharacterized protein LOC132631583 isoform X1 [Lycium barbarum]
MWGTWEELILGGSVLRHGTQDWNVVASELRSRTSYPCYFTPQACKAKYEDLQKRYSGCNAWFEELRKRRVEELKRELEKSESSIGSLLSKIESLKAEKDGSSHTELPTALVKSEYTESFGKDGISAGSFTIDTGTNYSPESESPAVASAKDIDSKLEYSEPYERNEIPRKSAETADGNGGALRKRKWKDSILDSKEGSIGESDDVRSISGISTTEDSKGGLSRLMNDDLMAIFNSIIQNEEAMVFRHRRDSQKRARYKEMIKQHMDVETVRSRLVRCSIKSPGELFRDLLLLATNAIVFYSKRTREYKAAMALRDIVIKAHRDHYKSSYHTAKKPRSARLHPSKFKIQAKSCNNVNRNADSEAPLQSLLAAKKGLKGHRKFKCGSVDGSVNRRTNVPGMEDTRCKTPVKEDHRSEVVMKERKRARKGDLQVA